MNDKIYTKISELLLFAVNFMPGDKIQINIDTDLRHAALNLADLAYSRGAEYVSIAYIDADLDSLAIKGKNENFHFPAYFQELYRETTQKGWKRIALLSEVNTDVFRGLDSERAARFFREKAASAKGFTISPLLK